MLLASISNSLEIKFENKFSKDLEHFPSLKTVWQCFVWEFILQNLAKHWCHILAPLDSLICPL
jgi:hypothetical protein